MSIRRKRSQPPILKSDINVTPFVDVMLVLLVIFMLGATSDMQQSLNLRLPKGGVKSSGNDKGNPRTIVSLDANGDLFLGDIKITKEDLIQRLKSMEPEKTEKIYIKAHEFLPYKDVVLLMTDLVKEGFTGLSLMAKSSEELKQQKKQEKTSEDFGYTPLDKK